jgi:serine protease SohB
VSEFLSAYGLFLLELATITVAVVAVILLIIATARRSGEQEGLSVRHLNEQLEERESALKRKLLGKAEFKKLKKAQAKERKQRAKSDAERPRVFVLDFKGDLRATAAASLREEISAVLAVAKQGDAVVVRLENAGGAVHEHGFAASQLMRLRQRGIGLTVAVDKVAASGGYLMACVADHILAAPFAILGSIGVIVQLPNFHRLLEDKGVDFELLTAGKYKRTLTLFGKNTDEGREKLAEELEEVHALFKRQIAEHRPSVDLDQVATGEHWYGIRALELKLCDSLGTSDDYLRTLAETADLYSVAYKRRKSLSERVLASTESLLWR